MVNLDPEASLVDSDVHDPSSYETSASQDSSTHQPSLRRNIAHLMSSQAVTWVLATLVAYVVPRFLGPSGLGRLRVSTAVWTMAQLFVALGTSTFLTLQIARDRQRGDRLVGPIIVMRVVAFGLCVVILAAIGVVLGVDLETVAIFGLIGLGVLIATVYEVWTAALNGLEQMKYPARTTVISRVIYSVLVLALVVSTRDVLAVAAAGLPSAVVSFVLLRSAFRRFGRVSFQHPFEQTRSIVRESRAFLVLGAVIVVYQQIDTVVISTLVDNEVVGWYSTADTLFGTLLFIPTTLMFALLPRFSRLHAEDLEGLGRLVRQVFSSSMLIAVPIGLGTMVVADRFVLTLYGDKYRETGPVLAVFGVVIIFTFGTILIGGLASATGHQRTWNIVMIAAIVASVPLDLVLIPWADNRYGNGAIGGALAYIVTESAMLTFGIWRFARTVVSRSSLIRLGKILVAGGLMVAATWPLRNLVFVVPAIVGTIVYGTTILVLRTLTDDEEDMVRKALSRLPGRRAVQA